MKHPYNYPQAELVLLTHEDILTASGVTKNGKGSVMQGEPINFWEGGEDIEG